MAGGRYRERAVFERLNAEAVDAYGQPHSAWESLTHVWADLRETTGKERLEAGAVNSAVTGTLRLRYSADAASITAADRVTIRGSIWNIRSVGEVGRKRKQVEMMIERGVS